MATRQYHPNLDDAEALKTFRLVRQAADIIFECAATDSRIWIHDNRHAIVTGYDTNQTTHGAFLEFYEGAPWHFWTPWGAWNFTTSVSESGDAAGVLNQLILARLETSLYRAGSAMTHGPLHALLAVDGQRLPKAKLVDPDEAIDFLTARAGWEALVAAS